MPFSTKTFDLIGNRLHIKPHYGNGWILCSAGGAFEAIGTPASFDADLVDVLIHEGKPHVLICLLRKPLGEHAFHWAAVLARSDVSIDLTQDATACNLLLSTVKPSVAANTPSWHPEFVVSNATLHVRGFGVVSTLAKSSIP